MSMSIDRSDIKKATGATQLAQGLFGDRLFLIIALIGSLVSGSLLVYMAFEKERIEVVYLDQEKIDVPTLLEKVRTSDQPISTDRWVRGFVRRFIAYYFLSPDDSTDFAKHALSWLHAHCGAAGKFRAEAYDSDFSRFDTQRKLKYSSFFAINDPSTLIIRPSKENSDVFFVEQPGTYVTKTEAGEAFFDARLRLVIEKEAVSGFASKLGTVNVTGLVVKNGSIEYVEDPTKSNEKTSVALFPPID